MVRWGRLSIELPCEQSAQCRCSHTPQLVYNLALQTVARRADAPHGFFAANDRGLGDVMVGSRIVAAALVAVSVGACGSIARGTTERMAFLTEPPGASMTTTKGYACPATPCSLEVDRSDEFDVTFAKPGYRPELVPVRTKVVGSGAAGMAGNVLLGGVIGIGVDAATGAALDHFPNPVSATLVPDALPSAQRARRRGRAGV